jgi:hypothetical protein
MTTIVPAVWAYYAAGFSVLALRGKVPTVRWRAYQHRRPTRAEVQSWIDASLFGNVGIVCGAVSGNLVVLDFDTPRAYGAFQARFPALAASRTVLTGGGGWHIYLRVDDLPPSMRGDGIELRSTGQQVVAPPSAHPDTGRTYRVVRDVPIRRVESLASVIGWLGEEPLQPKLPKVPPPVYGRLPDLIDRLAAHFRSQGYKPNGDWLNGPCIYPERHAHGDLHHSFGFNVRSGYGWCFRCQCSMLAKEIAAVLSL